MRGGGADHYRLNRQAPESAAEIELTLALARNEWPANAAKPALARPEYFDPLLHEE